MPPQATTLEPWGWYPQLFIGLETVGAVVVPKLGVVGHKGILNGRKHFSENPPLSLARQLIWQINLSRLPQRYFLHLGEIEKE